MSQPIETRAFPKPAPPQTPRADSPDAEAFDYSMSLRGRLNRWTNQLAAKIDADGGAVLDDGSTHPDLDLIAALIDAGCNLRRTAMERRIGGEILSYRARRPV
ncbi:hypothetical protein ABT189_00120 [Streptomyces sp900105755]|uniref:hypothetical protein n=1 Tax=Streptomyces sp. 900105755 TaxID=3154389 RepID=UPI00332E1213